MGTSLVRLVIVGLPACAEAAPQGRAVVVDEPEKANCTNIHTNERSY